MPEQRTPPPPTTDETALPDESLESVSGGARGIVDPGFVIFTPAVEPIVSEPELV